MKKDPFLSKYQIDYKKLSAATDISPIKRYLGWLQTTLTSGIGGMGMGSSLVFIVGWIVIAAIGTALAAAYTMAFTVGGGVIFAAFWGIYTAQQIKKDRAELKASLDELENNKKSFEDKIIELAKNFQKLNELVNQKYANLKKAGVLEGDASEFAKYLSGDFEFPSGRSPELDELQKIITMRRNMLRHLCANLSLVVGDSYQEKLANVFSSDVSNVANKAANKVEKADHDSVELAMVNLMQELNEMPLPNKLYSSPGQIKDRDAIAKQTLELESTLYKSYQSEKDKKHHKLFRRLTASYGVSALGGFFTGVGGYVAIASLAAGGAAALLTGGAIVPILLGGLAVGLVFAGCAILYRRHVENKKTAATKLITRTQKTLETGIADIKSVNEKSAELVEEIAKRQTKTADKQERIDAKNIGKLAMFVSLHVSEELGMAWKQIKDDYYTVEGRMSATARTKSKFYGQGESHDHDSEYLAALNTIKINCEELKTKCEKQAEILQVGESILKADENYQMIKNKLDKIVNTMAEIEKRQGFKPKPLMEEGQSAKKTQHREETVQDIHQPADDLTVKNTKLEKK